MCPQYIIFSSTTIHCRSSPSTHISIGLYALILSKCKGSVIYLFCPNSKGQLFNKKITIHFNGKGASKAFKKLSKKPVLRIRIRWIRKILASWIRIRKNMRIHGVKNQPKTAKKTFLLLKTNSELLK